MTSPLQGTLALSLINPGSILADYVSKTFVIVFTQKNVQLIHREAFGERFFLGSALNLIGYLGIASFNQPRKRVKPLKTNQNHELDELLATS